MQQQLNLAQQNRRARLAHLTALLNLVSGVGGVLAALAMVFVYRKRAPFVAFHALQAALFQLVGWVGGATLALLAWLAAAWLMERFAFGFCGLPIAFLISLAPLGSIVYAMLAAAELRILQDYRYPVIGEWALRLFQRLAGGR